MYGLPADINLEFLVGRELIQVAVGLHEIVLVFDDNVSISIESHCAIGGATYNPGAA